MEQLAGLNVHLGEQKIQVVRHYLFEWNETIRLTDAQQARDSGAHGNLDPRPHGCFFAGVPEGDEQVQGQIGNEGERVCRIDRLRCYQWKNIGDVV